MVRIYETSRMVTSMKGTGIISGALVSLVFPLFALADAPADVTELLNNIGTYIVNPIIFGLFTIAFVVFIWGLAQFVMNLQNEEARSTGAKHMIYGLIGMVIMVGVNGIVSIIDNTVRQIGG